MATLEQRIVDRDPRATAQWRIELRNRREVGGGGTATGARADGFRGTDDIEVDGMTHRTRKATRRGHCDPDVDDGAHAGADQVWRGVIVPQTRPGDSPPQFHIVV